MDKIPLYLKTDDNMPRPQDPVYYLLTSSGVYFCRNHAFFQSDVPATRPPRWLSDHVSGCRPRYPKLPVSTLEYIVGFFYQVYELHGSEAIVLLLWDLKRKRYRMCVPKQKATVWESSSGYKSALDVTYEVPTSLPAGCLLVASIHSHADGAAYSSWTDQHDETHRDGIHVVCGRIHEDPPQFHLELAVDGHRFPLQFDDFCQGYRARRKLIPSKWLEQVTCKVNRPKWVGASWNGRSTGSHGGGYYGS